MNWLDHKYIGLVSSRLERFKRKGNNTYNFRCPICGDSTVSRTKARGYIYETKGKSLFHCHNCNVTLDIPNFIKSIDNQLHKEYCLEKIKDNKTDEFDSFVEKMKKPLFLKDGPLKGLKKISQLPHTHRAHDFVTRRRLPPPSHIRLFYCPNFKHYVNELSPGKFDASSLERDEARLLIPFFDAHKNVHAFQGRALGESKVKYITIVLDETVPKVYGLDTTNFDRTVYVFEGPLDSLFIPNSIATAGGDLVSAINTLPKDRLVIVYDNEPRSRETIKKLDKAIMQGYNVCIWPDNLDAKDVNDMVLSGLSADFIKHIIDTHTYRDLAAKLALTKWSKV